MDQISADNALRFSDPRYGEYYFTHFNKTKGF